MQSEQAVWKQMPRTLRSALHWGVESLTQAGVPSPESDARWLLSAACGRSESEFFPSEHYDAQVLLLMHGDKPAPQEYYDWISRRVQREPLQHILGYAPFMGLELHSGVGAFIPRPETELLVERAAAYIAELYRQEDTEDITVVDLCSGPGTISLGLAYYCASHYGIGNSSGRRIRIYGFEYEDSALDYARRNLDNFPYEEWKENLSFHQADVRDMSFISSLLPGPASVVLSNPPYIPRFAELEPEVMQDPEIALFGGEDGLELIIPLIERVPDIISPEGVFMLEHDDSHGKTVPELLEKNNWTEIHTYRDLAHKPRYTVAHAPPSP